MCLLTAYLHLMKFDGSYEVRRAVLINITMSTKTVPQILELTHDVKEVIRKTAYQVGIDVYLVLQ